MPFNALLLPLLGGYIFLTNWNYTKFQTKRYSGERLLFHAATAGVALLIASFLVVRGLIALRPDFYTDWRAVVPFPYTGTSFGAFLLGCFLPPFANRFTSVDQAHADAVAEWGDYLEELVVSSFRRTKPLALTLKNGKVYVGLTTETLSLTYDRKYIKILPMLSGYREPDTHRLAFTTDYVAVLSQMIDKHQETEAEDFQIVVPASEIASANLFDFAAYDRFNAAEIQTLTGTGAQPFDQPGP